MQKVNEKTNNKSKPTPWSWKRFWLFSALWTAVGIIEMKIGYRKIAMDFFPMAWAEIWKAIPFCIGFGVFITLLGGFGRESKNN